MKKVVLILTLVVGLLTAEGLKEDRWQKDIPSQAMDLEKSAIVYLQMNIVDKAIGYFNQALEHKPNYYLAAYNLALAYYAKKDLDSSYEAFKKAYEIAKKDDIKDVMIYSLFGYASMIKGDENRSMIVFEEGLKIQTEARKKGLLLNNYGLLEFRKGNYAKSKKLFNQAIKLGNTRAIKHLEMIEKIQSIN